MMPHPIWPTGQRGPFSPGINELTEAWQIWQCRTSYRVFIDSRNRGKRYGISRTIFFGRGEITGGISFYDPWWDFVWWFVNISDNKGMKPEIWETAGPLNSRGFIFLLIVRKAMFMLANIAQNCRVKGFLAIAMTEEGNTAIWGTRLRHNPNNCIHIALLREQCASCSEWIYLAGIIASFFKSRMKMNCIG